MKSSRRTTLSFWSLLLIALGFCSCSGGADEAETNPLLEDPRIQRLMQGGRLSYYDRDTQNMIPIQVEKLRTAGGDPLRRAKEELGEMGSSAAIELRRVFDENFTNQRGIPFLENALDAAALNESDEAHDMLMAGLDHPMEAVRQRSLTGLISAHARPSDYDELLRRFETFESSDVRRKYLRTLFRADAGRAEQAALEWIRRGENLQFMAGFVGGLEASERPETGLLCGLLFREVPSTFQSQVAATAARFGDASALDFLRKQLHSQDTSSQTRAAYSLGIVGLFDELKQELSGSGPPSVRLMVLQSLALGAAQNPEIQGWMATGLSDQSGKVRDFALTELCKVGYQPALDQALAQLRGNVELMQPALLALRIPLLHDPKLAERALGVLTQRYAEEVAASDELHGRTLKAIGLIPGRRSAEFLRTRALELGELQVDGMGVHAWVMIGASNTGQEGLAFLMECLATEEDPVRRIDLIDALSSVREASSRDWLFELLATEQDPYEALFTAVELIKIGPSRLVASRIQKYCFESKHLETRQALQAMMWQWY